MDAQSVIDTLTPLVPGASLEVGRSIDFATMYVPADTLIETCRALRDTPALAFNAIIEITAVDYLPHEPRYEVVYHLLSVPNRARLRLKVRVAGGAAADGIVPTVQSIWPGAGWLEREVWDMFGIVFADHPDLRRLLMPEDWDGYPLRKDYPVQIRMTPHSSQPLQVTEQEFRANLERDRLTRR